MIGDEPRSPNAKSGMNPTDVQPAIPLRIRPYSRTSHIVAWLTPGNGRLVTLMKGSCRARSSFLGQYDLGYTCELVYYRRERFGLHLARECAAVKARPGFRCFWKSAVWLSYASFLLDRLAVESHCQPELFRLAESAMDHASARPANINLALWFELHAISAAGFRPRLDSCCACGSDSLQPDGRLLFSPRNGGIICAECARRPQDDSMPLSAATFSVLRSWLRLDSPQEHAADGPSPRQIYEASALIKRFMDYHLDMPPENRYACIQLLGSGPISSPPGWGEPS